MSPKQRKRTTKERATEVEAAETEAEGAAGEGEEPAADDAATGEDQPSRRPRNRSAAETAPAPTPARARRSADGDVVVRARAKYVRSAPRKTRLVIAHIRGKSVGEARAILTHTPRAASRDILTLLDSCVANAENNHELVADELYVDRAYVDEGPTLKRYRPRALGRATRINKRTSHMTIALRPRAGEE